MSIYIFQKINSFTMDIWCELCRSHFIFVLVLFHNCLLLLVRIHRLQTLHILTFAAPPIMQFMQQTKREWKKMEEKTKIKIRSGKL